jgi:hypothetical protein
MREAKENCSVYFWEKENQMRTMTKFVVAGMLAGACVFGGEDKADTSLGDILKKDPALAKSVEMVTKKMEKSDAVFEAAKAKHEEEISTLKESLVVVYETAMKSYTKKGDIRTATALMAAIDEMKGDDTEGSSSKSIKIIIGKWKVGTEYFDIRDDGSCSVSSGIQGKWSSNNGNIDILWSSGTTTTMILETLKTTQGKTIMKIAQNNQMIIISKE